MYSPLISHVNMLMHAVPFLNENKSVFSPENKVHGHNGLQVQTEQCQ